MFIITLVLCAIVDKKSIVLLSDVSLKIDLNLDTSVYIEACLFDIIKDVKTSDAGNCVIIVEEIKLAVGNIEVTEGNENVLVVCNMSVFILIISVNFSVTMTVFKVVFMDVMPVVSVLIETVLLKLFNMEDIYISLDISDSNILLFEINDDLP